MLGLAALRIITGVNILWFLIPVYIIALTLSFFVPKIFMGISFDSGRVASGTGINRETDSVFFLTTLEYKTRIMEAVRDAAGLKTEGGAVIFSLPVDDLVGVGRFEDYVDGEENR